MIDVQVLGIGCTSCRTTLALVEEVVHDAGVAAVVRKVDDPQAFVTYGVMRPPAVVVDGRLVHVGGVPSRSQVARWIREVVREQACPADTARPSGMPLGRAANDELADGDPLRRPSAPRR